jgi:hypothetical protein
MRLIKKNFSQDKIKIGQKNFGQDKIKKNLDLVAALDFRFKLNSVNTTILFVILIKFAHVFFDHKLLLLFVVLFALFRQFLFMHVLSTTGCQEIAGTCLLSTLCSKKKISFRL